MQEQDAAPLLSYDAEQLCKNCSTLPALSGYPTPLCNDCRRALIRYPIPKWIWLFAGGVLVVMLIGLVQMPKYFNASLHLARAERAYDTHKYLTAQRELAHVVLRFPHDVSANAKLLVASIYNGDYTAAQKAYAVVENEKFEDKELLEKMQTAMGLIQQNIPNDTLLVSRFNALPKTPEAMDAFYLQVDSGAGGDAPIAGMLIADRLYDMKQYAASGAMLEKVLDKRPDWPIAVLLLSGVKRSLGDYEGALALCNHLLEQNKEDVRTIAMKARIELKRKHDAAARKYAVEAMSLNGSDVSAMESMAMVEYYAGKEEASRTLLARVRQSEYPSGDSTVSKRLASIINGTESYR